MWSNFYLYREKSAAKCGYLAMTIMVITKHSMLHDQKKNDNKIKKRMKQVDWRESKMLPPVTSCCFRANTNVSFLLSFVLLWNFQTLVQFPRTPVRLFPFLL